jgi:hypothetical protein
MNDKTETKQFGIHFGALSDSISKQLEKQGLKFNAKEVDQFQNDLDAIQRLRFRSILTDTTSSKCFEKLYKKILTHITKTNKLKVVK